MREYEFTISLNGGYCNGTITIEAENYDEAYTKCCDEVCNGLRDFPLEVNYDVDCISNLDDEDY